MSVHIIGQKPIEERVAELEAGLNEVIKCVVKLQQATVSIVNRIKELQHGIGRGVESTPEVSGVRSIEYGESEIVPDDARHDSK